MYGRHTEVLLCSCPTLLLHIDVDSWLYDCLKEWSLFETLLLIRSYLYLGGNSCQPLSPEHVWLHDMLVYLDGLWVNVKVFLVLLNKEVDKSVSQ